MEGQWQWGEWWRQASGEDDDGSINRKGGVAIGIGPRSQVKTPHEEWQLCNYLVTKIDWGDLGSERINARLNSPIQFGFLIELWLISVKYRDSVATWISRKINFLIWGQICPTLKVVQAIGAVRIEIWELFFVNIKACSFYKMENRPYMALHFY